jgi:hypothetical protein
MWGLGNVMQMAVERSQSQSQSESNRLKLEYAKLAIALAGYTVSIYCVWKTYVSTIIYYTHTYDYSMIRTV